ncbi:hypothetical protein [Gimesia aquarii]|uniref:Uncharacterized protein n=1 Tax=Gimesia aquarii TaxID=2527964 RepID=A0A517VXM9_9PLAN|nr:hypothetical protein [Gimesia aquarii]QDT97763.1 hypothetical protein V144x_32450 [Gimesia aquarii]
MFYISRFGGVGLVSFFLLIQSTSADQSKSHPIHSAEIEKIFRQWESMESEIKTANFTLDRFIFRTKNFKEAPTKFEITEIITTRLLPLVKLKYTLEDLKLATNDLVNSKVSAKREWKGNWVRYEVTDDGEKLLNEASFDVDKKNNITSKYTRFKSKNANIRYVEANQSARVTKQSSAVKYFSIKDLRLIPNLVMLKNEKDLQLLETETELNQLLSKKYNLEFNSNNGFVHRLTTLNGSGSPLNEVLQFEPQMTTTGISVPSMIVKYYFTEDSRVRSCLILILSKLKLNETFSENSFQVLVPKGTSISNVSKSNTVIGQEKTQESETDVLSFSKDIPDFTHRHEQLLGDDDRNSSIKWAIVIGINVTFFVLIIAMVIRRKKSNSK